MSEDTRIEWADDTVNPWWGCTKVSPACRNCYAETFDRRGLVDGGGHWGPTAPRFTRIPKALAELDRIANRGAREGRPRRVFIASMADVFEDRADLVEPRLRLWEHLHKLGRRVVPLLLTKRPDVMAEWAAVHGWPEGAWAGTTVEDQRRADERLPHLFRVPARRFISAEPLLGPVDLFGVDTVAAQSMPQGPYPGDVIDWVIAGGESGASARPSRVEWFRQLRDQCEEVGVPFLFKQWGRFVVPSQMPEETWQAIDRRPHGFPSYEVPLGVGKKAAGRLLDGQTHDALPEAPHD